MVNAFPNFANDNPELDADLTPAQKDILWIHQVMGAQANKRHPMTLDNESALKAGATSTSPSFAEFMSLLTPGILLSLLPRPFATV